MMHTGDPLAAGSRELFGVICRHAPRDNRRLTLNGHIDVPQFGNVPAHQELMNSLRKLRVAILIAEIACGDTPLAMRIRLRGDHVRFLGMDENSMGKSESNGAKNVPPWAGGDGGLEPRVDDFTNCRYHLDLGRLRVSST